MKDGNIQLTFVKGKADNPIIQGIIMYHGPIEGRYVFIQKHPNRSIRVLRRIGDRISKWLRPKKKIKK